eukprot:1157958-Pelagomonas_calceolata.AAC.4
MDCAVTIPAALWQLGCGRAAVYGAVSWGVTMLTMLWQLVMWPWCGCYYRVVHPLDEAVDRVNEFQNLGVMRVATLEDGSLWCLTSSDHLQSIEEDPIYVHA